MRVGASHVGLALEGLLVELGGEHVEHDVVKVLAWVRVRVRVRVRASMLSTMWSKSSPPRWSSQPRPLTTIGEVKLSG